MLTMLIYFYKVRDRIREKQKIRRGAELQQDFLLSLDNIKKPASGFLDKYLNNSTHGHGDDTMHFYVPTSDFSHKEIVERLPLSISKSRRFYIFEYEDYTSVHINRHVYTDGYSAKGGYLKLIEDIVAIFNSMSHEEMLIIVSSFGETLEKIETLVKGTNYSSFSNSESYKKVCCILKEIKETCEVLSEKSRENITEGLGMELEYAIMQKEKIKMLTSGRF